MIAVDTNALSSFFGGETNRSTDAVSQAFLDRSLCLPPVVQAELLSDPSLSREATETIVALPLIAILPGYWQRSGELRRELLRKGRKARLPDILVAQSALDFDLPLLTSDRDFKAIQSIRKLKLL